MFKINVDWKHNPKTIYVFYFKINKTKSLSKQYIS